MGIHISQMLTVMDGEHVARRAQIADVRWRGWDRAGSPPCIQVRLLAIPIRNDSLYWPGRHGLRPANGHAPGPSGQPSNFGPNVNSCAAFSSTTAFRPLHQQSHLCELCLPVLKIVRLVNVVGHDLTYCICAVLAQERSFPAPWRFPA
jgi:hypothetical protein